MRARDLMRREPISCTPSDTLALAAQKMRKRDCGFLPVVADGLRLVGVLTDRDICLAAEAHGRALHAIAVEGAMHADVHACRPDARVENILALMVNYRVRRVPVVDDHGHLVGVISLSDLARRADGAKSGPLTADGVGRTLASICEPRSAAHYA
jgi:CBS domain-containing protein